MVCNRRHALVTGASTGIGRATALRLAKSGFHVFATVRQTADGTGLSEQADGDLTPLIMDTTISELVVAAADEVDRHVGEKGLDVLVNNAGVPLFQPVEFLSPQNFLAHMDVNVAGPLRVTQALLPSIRRCSGRIIVIGSSSSWFVSPFGGSHSATKSALAGLTEALRLELEPWKIDVVLIEPGAVRSNAFTRVVTGYETATRDMGPLGRELYGDSYKKMIDKTIEFGNKGTDPDVVADVVLRAVNLRHPKRRYLAGDARQLAWLAKLPTAVLDAMQRSMFNLPKPGSKVAPQVEPAGAR